MKDPKYLQNCVEIMSIIHDTIKSFYHDAQRGISVQPVPVSFCSSVYCYTCHILY